LNETRSKERGKHETKAQKNKFYLILIFLAQHIFQQRLFMAESTDTKMNGDVPDDEAPQKDHPVPEGVSRTVCESVWRAKQRLAEAENEQHKFRSFVIFRRHFGGFPKQQ
jgi:hypothetical protein